MSFDFRGDQISTLVHQGNGVDLGHLQARLVALQARPVENVPHQLVEMAAGKQNFFEVIGVLLLLWALPGWALALNMPVEV